MKIFNPFERVMRGTLDNNEKKEKYMNKRIQEIQATSLIEGFNNMIFRS